jgi:hypothetical protein
MNFGSNLELFEYSNNLKMTKEPRPTGLASARGHSGGSLIGLARSTGWLQGLDEQLFSGRELTGRWVMEGERNSPIAVASAAEEAAAVAGGILQWGKRLSGVRHCSSRRENGKTA